MKILLSALLLGLVSACAAPPQGDTPAYRDREASTGSNIPRRGTASQVNVDSVDDLRNKTSGINLRSGS